MYRIIVNTFVVRVLSTALNFFIVLMLAREAGPAIKGEVTLLITTTWFFIFLSNILGGQALIYLIPRNRIELLVVPAYIWSVIIAAIGFAFLKSTHIVHAEHITSVIVLSLLSSFITIHQTILLAKKQITNSNLLQIISLLFQVSGMLVCFLFLDLKDAFAYIYASLIAYSFTTLLSFFLIKDIVYFSGFIGHFSWKDLKTAIRYGVLYQLVEVFQLLNLRYYYYQLGLQEGQKYLGIYSIGIAVLESVWIIPRSIATVQYVSTSNTEVVKEEAARIIQLVKLSVVLSAVALFIIYLVPSSFYVFVFSDAFRSVKYSMRFLFPGILVYNLLLVISSFYLGTGKYRQLIIANLAGFASLFFFSRLLIPPYVMSGAGLAATLSFSIASIFLLLFFISDNRIPVSRFLISRKDAELLWKKVRGK